MTTTDRTAQHYIVRFDGEQDAYFESLGDAQAHAEYFGGTVQVRLTDGTLITL